MFRCSGSVHAPVDKLVKSPDFQSGVPSDIAGSSPVWCSIFIVSVAQLVERRIEDPGIAQVQLLPDAPVNQNLLVNRAG